MGVKYPRAQPAYQLTSSTYTSEENRLTSEKKATGSASLNFPPDKLWGDQKLRSLEVKLLFVA